MSYLYPVLDFELRHHHPNKAIDDMLHGDRVRTDENGEEVIDEGTPEPPVVIETETDPDPDPPNPNPDPGPASEPSDEPQTLTGTHALIGGDNNDTLTVDESGHNYTLLDGKAGNDTLTAAGSGFHVVMIGGPGNDVFDVAPTSVWQDHHGNEGVSNNFTGRAFIMDFEDGRDKIKIGDGDAAPGLLRFFNAIREAGLTFDMDWIAADTGADVLLEVQGEAKEILIKDVNMHELQLNGYGRRPVHSLTMPGVRLTPCRPRLAPGGDCQGVLCHAIADPMRERPGAKQSVLSNASQGASV